MTTEHRLSNEWREAIRRGDCTPTDGRAVLEYAERLEWLLLECIDELEYHGVGNSITTNKARAALVKPAPATRFLDGESPYSWILESVVRGRKP